MNALNGQTKSDRAGSTTVAEIVLRLRPKLDEMFAPLLSPTEPATRHRLACHMLDNLFLLGVSSAGFVQTFNALFQLLPTALRDQSPQRALTVLMTIRGMIMRHCDFAYRVLVSARCGL